MIKIEIKTDNDAFDGAEKEWEIARILRKIASDFDLRGNARATYNDISCTTAATPSRSGPGGGPFTPWPRPA